ncbi:hypothetical protein ACP70R_013000 [Stipagrostis hirtigluma subsp. patula]
MISVDDLIAELRALLAKILGKKKRKECQVFDVVRMDCEGCERRVRKALEGMKGVTKVDVNPKESRVTVEGFVEAAEVAARLRRRAGKKAEPYPFVPYEAVAHPYAPGAYDHKAPPGYVRNVLDDPDAAPLVRASSAEERYTSAFSDDNPNSCAVM